MGQIKLLLTKSDLSSKQQNELLAILKLLPTVEVNELADFLASNPEWVDKLYYNYKQKKELATSKDSKKWQELFDQEKIELEKL